MPRTPLQGRVAILTRHRAPDDPELLEARRDFKAEGIANYVRRKVAVDPPLTEAQISHIVSILRGSEDGCSP